MGIQLRVGWSERLYTVTRISSGCLLRGRVGALNIKSLSSEYGTRMLFEARFWPWRSGQRRENPLEMVSFCLESGPQPSTLNTQHSTLNTQHSTLNPQHSSLNTQHSTLNTQHSTLNPTTATRSSSGWTTRRRGWSSRTSARARPISSRFETSPDQETERHGSVCFSSYPAP